MVKFEPGMEYEFKLQAENGFGPSEYSQPTASYRFPKEPEPPDQVKVANLDEHDKNRFSREMALEWSTPDFGGEVSYLNTQCS